MTWKWLEILRYALWLFFSWKGLPRSTYKDIHNNVSGVMQISGICVRMSSLWGGGRRKKGYSVLSFYFRTAQIFFYNRFFLIIVVVCF